MIYLITQIVPGSAGTLADIYIISFHSLYPIVWTFRYLLVSLKTKFLFLVSFVWEFFCFFFLRREGDRKYFA